MSNLDGVAPGSQTREGIGRITRETENTTQETHGTTQETTKETRSTTQEIQETAQDTTKEITLAMLRKHPELTHKALAEHVGIIPDGIKYHLDNLRKSGQYSACRVNQERPLGS